MDSAISQLHESCHLCLSVSKFPKELEIFTPELFPDHPGQAMNADILKRASQLVLVNMDLFSSYTTACFVESEKADDLAVALIQAVTPIRSNKTLNVRVDKAPGLVKLASSSHTLLDEVGIKLVLADDGNKNSNCCIDKVIKELEDELKKISPDGDKLSTADLAQATMCLNSKIRKRGLTASEIHFSRDSHDSSNLILDDQTLQETQEKLRYRNHQYLNVSRAPGGKLPVIPEPDQGDIVFLKNGETKHTARDPFIVMEKRPGKSLVRKTIHSSSFANAPIKMSPHTQVIANKFLFKPKVKEKDAHYVENIQCETFAPSPTEIHPPWSPISVDDVLDLNLIPIHCPTDSNDYIQTEELNQQYLPALNNNASLPSNDYLSDSYSQDLSQPLDEDPLHQPLPDSDTTNSNVSDVTSTNSEPGNNEIITFNDGEGLNIPERLNQEKTPEVGDIISFYDGRKGYWVEAKIIKDLTSRWNHYYNISYADNKKDGLYLIPDTRWTFVQNWNSAEEQLEQTYILGDLDPTSSTTSEPRHDLGFSSPSPAPTIFEPNISTTDSLEWDNEGTDLIQSTDPSYLNSLYDFPLDRVQHLDNLLPLPLAHGHPAMRPQLDLHEVIDLRLHLPLSSTPSSQRRQPPTQFQSMPEQETRRLNLINFLRRLNPFKKKHSGG